jgi:hypothetical protein
MIVEAFKESLELGLQKPGQVVVRIRPVLLRSKVSSCETRSPRNMS